MLLRKRGWNSAKPLNVRSYCEKSHFRKRLRTQSMGSKGLTKKKTKLFKKSHCNRKSIDLLSCLLFSCTDRLSNNWHENREREKVRLDNGLNDCSQGVQKFIYNRSTESLCRIYFPAVNRWYRWTPGSMLNGRRRSGEWIFNNYSFISRRCVSSEKESDCWAPRQQVLTYST